ncbi:uncharacterized protein BXIN_1221 [Babesia sp. Xinjiang]|uniref:uncharacterized protein n=1 Tax=Babesia sp. Xinjiang TaxID=462227 RepID=UPI000A247845|nr:uncharacterized protein BXIN_1221 [Babesia sp. Xinjiang]ORM40186.1 hypothetical protein BXIN_1221 [Babesia sp. Xinjiang]
MSMDNHTNVYLLADCKINGRGIRRGSEGAMVKPEIFYFRELDENAKSTGLRRIEIIAGMYLSMRLLYSYADSRPDYRPNIFMPAGILSRLNLLKKVHDPQYHLPLTCPSLPPDAILSDDTIQALADADEAIWKLKPVTVSDGDQSAVSNNCDGIDSSTGYPLRWTSTSLRNLDYLGIDTVDEKVSPTNCRKTLSGHLMDIFMNAVTSAKLRYIKDEQLLLGGQDADIDDGNEVATTAHAAQKDDYETTLADANSDLCYAEDNQTHLSADEIQSDGAYFDAVSMSTSSAGELFDEDNSVCNKLASSTALSLGSQGGNITEGRKSYNISDIESTECETLEKAKEVKQQSPVASHGCSVEAPQPIAVKLIAASIEGSPTSTGLYQSVPARLSAASPVLSDIPQQSVERYHTPIPETHTCAGSDVTMLTPNPEIHSESRNVQNRIGVMSMVSPRLINNAVKVKPQQTIDHPRRDGPKGMHEKVKAFVDTMQSNWNAAKNQRVCHPLKNHATEMRHNKLCMEFIANYNERRQMEYLKGARMPVQRISVQLPQRIPNLRYGCQRNQPVETATPQPPGLMRHAVGAPKNPMFLPQRRFYSDSSALREINEKSPFRIPFKRTPNNMPYTPWQRDPSISYNQTDSRASSTASRLPSNESMQAQQEYRHRSFERSTPLYSRSDMWRPPRTFQDIRERSVGHSTWRAEEEQRLRQRSYDADYRETYSGYRDQESYTPDWHCRSLGSSRSRSREREYEYYSRNRQWYLGPDAYRRCGNR